MVTDEHTLQQRTQKREREEGKMVPVSAVMDMKVKHGRWHKGRTGFKKERKHERNAGIRKRGGRGGKEIRVHANFPLSSTLRWNACVQYFLFGCFLLFKGITLRGLFLVSAVCGCATQAAFALPSFDDGFTVIDYVEMPEAESRREIRRINDEGRAFKANNPGMVRRCSNNNNPCADIVCSYNDKSIKHMEGGNLIDSYP